MHCYGVNLNALLPFPHGAATPNEPGSPQYWGFTITLGHNTRGRTSLDE